MTGRRRAASAEGVSVLEAAARAVARTPARPRERESRRERRPPDSAPRRAGIGPGRGRKPPILLGTSRQHAPLCSREGEARRLLQDRRGNPRPRVLGAKSALLSSPRRLGRFLTVAAGCVRGPGRGWGAQGGGLGARPVAGPAVLCFPAWLLDPPRGCSLMLQSAARTSRTRQTFPSLHVERLPRGNCTPDWAEIRAT